MARAAGARGEDPQDLVAKILHFATTAKRCGTCSSSSCCVNASPLNIGARGKGLRVDMHEPQGDCLQGRRQLSEGTLSAHPTPSREKMSENERTNNTTPVVVHEVHSYIRNDPTHGISATTHTAVSVAHARAAAAQAHIPGLPLILMRRSPTLSMRYNRSFFVGLQSLCPLSPACCTLLAKANLSAYRRSPPVRLVSCRQVYGKVSARQGWPGRERRFCACNVASGCELARSSAEACRANNNCFPQSGRARKRSRFSSARSQRRHPPGLLQLLWLC